MANPTDENMFPSPAGRQETSGISRRPVLEYFNPGMVGGRFRRFFTSREKMVEAAKTLGWVIPLTLLIWIYAEREQVVQPNSPNVQNVMITLKSSPDLYVEFADRSPQTVNLQLTGPQQAFEKVKEQLTMHIPLGITVDVGSSLNPGKNQAVNVVSLLQNQDLFKNNGVTVQESQPPDIRVDVDRKIHRQVPVQIPASVNNLSADTHFEPAHVEVSGPKTLVDQVDLVYAKLEGNPLLNQPGNHIIASVPLESALKVDISPAQVTADIAVHASDVSYTITDPPVPIAVTQLVPTLTNYDFSLTDGDGTLAGVTVTGPQQQIDKIKSGKFQVVADLEVDPSDAGNSAVTKTLQYVLPPGVKVSDEDAHRTVKFKLSRKN
jgi:hypothetical protein